MVILVIAQGNTYDHRAEESGTGQFSAFRSKILADVELELVGTGRQQLVPKQRLLGAPVVVRYSMGAQLSFLAEGKKPNGNTCGRHTIRCVQYVRRQSSHKTPLDP